MQEFGPITLECPVRSSKAHAELLRQVSLGKASECRILRKSLNNGFNFRVVARQGVDPVLERYGQSLRLGNEPSRNLQKACVKTVIFGRASVGQELIWSRRECLRSKYIRIILVGAFRAMFRFSRCSAPR
jgi:hypothetical protein